MKGIAFLAVAIFVTGCSSRTPRDFQTCRWSEGTNVLDAGQVTQIVGLLEANLVPPQKKTEKTIPDERPLPMLAPDLCVNIQSDDGKLMAQLLVFDGKEIEFGSLGSVNNSNVVQQINKIVKDGTSRSHANHAKP